MDYLEMIRLAREAYESGDAISGGEYLDILERELKIMIMGVN